MCQSQFSCPIVYLRVVFIISCSIFQRPYFNANLKPERKYEAVTKFWRQRTALRRTFILIGHCWEKCGCVPAVFSLNGIARNV